MVKRGKLFVLEGPDGVGKSTLAHMLVEYLNVRDMGCDLVAFPGRAVGTLGQHIYTLHHDPARFGVQNIHPTSLQVLHVAAHIDTLERCIRPALEEGRSVVLDRFWWSMLVYGKVYGANLQVLEIMLQAELAHWSKLVPDAVFLLKRSASLRSHDTPDTWSALSAAYDDLARLQGQQCPVHVIHNEQSIETTLAHMLKKISHASQKQLGEARDIEEAETLETFPERRAQEMEVFSPKRSNRSASTSLPTIFTSISPAEPTEVFDTYWRFAAKRQEIFFQRWEGGTPPWTSDPILSKYKFTNAYRASDRVSQYLIKEVIYRGAQSPEEVFFRVLLFKIFNNIDTWKLLLQHFGEIRYADYAYERYDAVLTEAIEGGRTIFSAAYIMPSGTTTFGYPKKHRNYLRLVETMLVDEVPQRLANMRSMHQAFDLLRSYPLLGDFLAYQYVTDLNYSQLTNFSEMDFVVPGPGARSGIRKCFHSLGGLSEADVIRLVAGRQEEEFTRLGLVFRSLWGRPLQLIDCQNLFCEVDKYARIAHPTVKGVGDRTRIKQVYQAKPQPIEYWYPPKWRINHLIQSSNKERDKS